MQWFEFRYIKLIFRQAYTPRCLVNSVDLGFENDIIIRELKQTKTASVPDLVDLLTAIKFTLIEWKKSISVNKFEEVL